MSTDTDQTPEPQRIAAPREAKPRSLSARRKRLQLPLLLVALVGLGLAGGLFWWEWTTTVRSFAVHTEGSHSTVAPDASFDLSQTTIPRDKILAGGPPKDGIPALTSPKFVAAAEAQFLRPADWVIGVRFGDDARAYPLKILEYHEAINDRVGGRPILVTYCPLCDSAAVFDRCTGDGEAEFGVSGLLYNSNVLLYDRNKKDKESLWSQIMTQGVSGPRAKETLKSLPLEVTIWADWSRRNPQTRVLSTATGHTRNYDVSPYAGYFTTPRLMFPAEPRSEKMPAKTPVLGVWVEKTFRAYPMSAFEKIKDREEIEQELMGVHFKLVWNSEARSVRVVSSGEGLSWMYSFWFAWYAFHPETEVVEELRK